MDVVHPIGAGIDGHQADSQVCWFWRDASGQRPQAVRTYRTLTGDWLAMRAWLPAQHCAVGALESTGVDGRPGPNRREGDFQVRRVNPTHSNPVPGRKPDGQDCQGLAERRAQGLLPGSCIPPRAIRDRRDRTRDRRKRVEMRSAAVNRRQKRLEQANRKRASVASDSRGVSGRALLGALRAGEPDPAKRAELSQGRLRNQKDDWQAALGGRFRPQQAQWLSELLAHSDCLAESIAQREGQLDAWCRPVEAQIVNLDTMTGIHRRAAQDVLAESGVDRSHFPSHKHWWGWAHLAPGNNESGGKRRSGRTGKGNPWLRAILVECAHAAGRSKDTSLGEQYRRGARRKDKQRAAVVVAQSMLEGIYFRLRDHVPYQALGAHHFDQVNATQVVRYPVRRLERMGYTVEVHAPPTQELPVAA